MGNYFHNVLCLNEAKGMDISMNKQLEMLLDTETIIIFGFSRLGKRLCDELLLNGCKKIFFCDGSSNKIGQEYRGVKVLSVEQSEKRGTDKKYIICSLFHQNSMKGELLELGIISDRIYFPPTVLIEEEKRIMREERLDPKQKFTFEVDIAMHCNLKCKSCHHFSPLAKEEITDINVFKRDFQRLKDLFGEDVERIYLLGGEPLLNKDISSYLGIARNYFHNTKIELVSNGILLPKMDNKFWITCHDNRIKISVTKYPIKVDYSKIEEICQRHKVDFAFFGSAVNDKHMSHYPLDINGKQEIEKNFYSCNMANNCITLKKGKLYPCVLPPNIIHFNTYFGENLEVDKKDGIDIYDVQSKEDILNFLSKPIPFCRYCAVERRTYDNLWEYSKQKIEEWI